MFGFIRKYRELKNKAETLELENGALRRDNKSLRDRLRRAGSLPYEYFESDKIKTIEAEAKTYGEFAVLDSNADHPTEDEIEKAKSQVVYSLVRCLMKDELIQFIVKDRDFYNGPLYFDKCTVAAKLNVIPWEQMTRKIVLFPKVEEEYGKHKDADDHGSETSSGYACVFTGEIEASQTENPIGKEMEEE